GIVLYECLTGHPPYWSTDPGELIRMHAGTPVPDVRSMRPDLSATFAEVIATLMAKDPGHRHQGGESLLADLHRLAAQPGACFPVAQQAGEPRSADPDRLLGRDNE